MIKNKVSIIMPAYNVENVIEETIQSVLQQTYKDWELIVVDDCSKDSTYSILKSYESEKVRVFRNSTNLGVIRTRNFALNQTTGEYIAFLDSDDVWMPEKLEIQINYMIDNDCSFSCTDYYKMDSNSELIGKVYSSKKNITYNDLLKTNYIGCLTAVYNTSRLGKFFFKDFTYNEDYIYWLDILSNTDVCLRINEYLAKYRVYKGSRSSQKLKVAKYQWYIYRKVIKLSLLKSVIMFTSYAINGLVKRAR